MFNRRLAAVVKQTKRFDFSFFRRADFGHHVIVFIVFFSGTKIHTVHNINFAV